MKSYTFIAYSIVRFVDKRDQTVHKQAYYAISYILQDRTCGEVYDIGDNYQTNPTNFTPNLTLTNATGFGSEVSAGSGSGNVNIDTV